MTKKSDISLTLLPDPILKRVLADVPDDWFGGEEIKELAEEMHQAMLDANGIGLAANQVGRDLRFFVIDKNLAEENKIPNAFANPEITESSKDTDEMEEGCLSIPGFTGLIRRPKKIKFKGFDIEGNKIKIKARGMLAKVLQHETDHLNGVTIKDYSEN